MDDVIDTEVHSRSKRNAYSLGKTIREYTIEVLVAVDKKMQEKHRTNLKEYVLTLMSTVSFPCFHTKDPLNSTPKSVKRSQAFTLTKVLVTLYMWPWCTL